MQPCCLSIQHNLSLFDSLQPKKLSKHEILAFRKFYNPPEYMKELLAFTQAIQCLSVPFDESLLTDEFFSTGNGIQNKKKIFQNLIVSQNIFLKKNEGFALDDNFIEKHLKAITNGEIISDDKTISISEFGKLLTKVVRKATFEFYSKRHLEIIKLSSVTDDKKLRIKILSRDCGEYALFRVNSSSINHLIYSENSLNVDPNNFVEYLTQNLNFYPVKKPQAGDLIVYFTDQGEPNHLGYCCSDNLIESKLGRMSIIVRHAPENTFYGNSYIYFRPKVNRIPS